MLEHAEQGVGASRRFYEKLLRSAGVPVDEVWTTFLMHCPPDRGKPVRKSDRDQCKRWLWKELKLAEPQIVFAFGTAPTSLLLRSKIALDEIVGQPILQEYLPGGRTIVVPMLGLDKLWKGPMYQIQDAVEFIRENVR